MFTVLPRLKIKSLLRGTLLLLFVSSLLITSGYQYVEGHVCYEPTTECYRHNQAEINKWKNQLSELNQQERTLSNQISYLGYQISLTEAEIENAKAEIKILSVDIGDLSDRLKRIADFIDYQEDIFRERARAAYASDQLSPFDIVLGADTLDTAFRKIKYLKVLEAQDRETLEEMKETRVSFNDQKKALEGKKADVEVLKKELEGKTASLANQKITQQNLLTLTKNDQSLYKNLIEQGRSAQELLAQLVFRGGTPYWTAYTYDLQYKRQVSSGEAIATQGSGDACSTGGHLHLLTLESATLANGKLSGIMTNPLAYIRQSDVNYWDMDDRFRTGYLGWGSGPWPMTTNSSFYVTQLYGRTAFAQRYYVSKFHTGIDMVNNSNKTIRAISGGKLYRTKMGCAAGYANVMIIDHGGGKFSAYQHVR
ncbi:MAG: hypothetical protein BMS9Abin34_355 [Patescibacteria group bacterium]|nr:MAG: hypothetical protein BMS9Abin34_355 [Patescibacteria group bacterium]